MSIVKKKNENIVVVHCLRHRGSLEPKQMQEDLVRVFKDVISVVNYSRSFPLCPHLFQALYVKR